MNTPDKALDKMVETDIDFWIESKDRELEQIDLFEEEI